MQISIDTNAAEVKKLIKGLPNKVVKPALVTSINRAARDGKSSAIKAASRATGIKQKAVRKRITGARGSARATRKRLSAMIFIRTSYGVKISEAVSKGAVKKFGSKSSFRATMPSGYFSAFERTGKKKRATKSGRYYGRKATRGPNKGKLIKREPITEILLPLDPVATKAAKAAFMSRARVVVLRELKRNIERKLDAQKKTD